MKKTLAALWALGALAALSGSPAAAQASFIEVRLVEQDPARAALVLPLQTEGGRIGLRDSVMLDASHVDNAFVDEKYRAEGRYRVALELTAEGDTQMRRFTREHQGERVGVIVGGEIAFAPVIAEEVGKFLAVYFDLEKGEADERAAAINEALSEQGIP